MTILFILFLIISIVLGILYYLQYVKLKYYESVSNNLSSMNVIQKMFEIIGSNLTSDEKIKKLNDVIIDSFSVKYSTIVIFEGNSYEIKATNVEDTYIDSIKDIAEENDFKGNALKNVSKYITTSSTKTLTYKSAIERKIKSCLFSPIYYNNIYIGFWILEDEVENSFDTISKNDLVKLKDNMGVFLENVRAQNIIETAENTDKQTGFYNNLYLYSNSVQILNSKQNSAIILLCLYNLEDINDKFGRNVGNLLLVKVANLIKEVFSSDTIFIRYSGKRILIMCPGSNAELIHSLVERLMNSIVNISEYVNEQKVGLEPQILIHTFIQQNNIEKELQKMVSYIDKMSDTKVIKII